MSKIREEAHEVLEAHKAYTEAVFSGDSDLASRISTAAMIVLKKESNRVLLLEKAYRYQRAANRLNKFSWRHLHFDERISGLSYAQSVRCEVLAGDLYRHAEEQG